MHPTTRNILDNLGVETTDLSALKSLGLPKTAIRQIKQLEKTSLKKLGGLSPQDLADTLIKKCRRSFDSFANKGIPAKLVANKSGWNLFAEEYSVEVENLLKVIKPYMDHWTLYGLQVEFLFDGSPTWSVKKL